MVRSVIEQSYGGLVFIKYEQPSIKECCTKLSDEQLQTRHGRDTSRTTATRHYVFALEASKEFELFGSVEIDRVWWSLPAKRPTFSKFHEPFGEKVGKFSVDIATTNGT